MNSWLKEKTVRRSSTFVMHCLFTILIRNLFHKSFTNQEEGQARHANVFFLIVDSIFKNEKLSHFYNFKDKILFLIYNRQWLSQKKKKKNYKINKRLRRHNFF